MFELLQLRLFGTGVIQPAVFGKHYFTTIDGALQIDQPALYRSCDEEGRPSTNAECEALVVSSQLDESRDEGGTRDSLMSASFTSRREEIRSPVMTQW